MFSKLISVIYYIADICYLTCNCLYEFAFTSLAKIFQPDVYGATVYEGVGPFRGTEWNFALNNSDSNFVEDAIATILNWLDVNPNTTLFEAVFYCVCIGLGLVFIVRIFTLFFGAIFN